jgi:mRNA interferase MazF
VTWRWSVVDLRLDPAEGHEQAGRRPVLVVSNEAFNTRTDLLTVLPITSEKPDRPARAFEVALPAGTAGLAVDSIALPQQLRTVAQSRVVRPARGRITDAALRRRIADGVLLHLGLEEPDLLADEP